MNRFRIYRLRLLLMALSLTWVGLAEAQPNGQCLSYEPAVVRLPGVIISRTYPGAPNYESVKNGDEPETYWLLALPRPMCVAQKGDADIYPAEKNIRRIQLVFSSEKAYKRYRPLLGKRVIAIGTLYPGFNIHHKTPVLLTVSTLERARSHPYR